MKHKWLIAVFAGVFLLSCALGVAIRFAIGGGLPSSTESAQTGPTSDAPQTEPLPEITAPPETVPPETDPPQTDPPATEPPAVEPQPAGDVRICIGGDTSVDSEFADFARSKGVDYPWEEISELMNSADISIVNLETCVSDRGTSEKKAGYGFQTPPEMLEGFVNAGIDLVNLANNHVRDFGYDALLDTFDNLDANGIGYFGAGHDLDEAGGLKVVEINGVKVGFTGANRVSLNGDCAAKEGHAGVNQVGDIDSDSSQEYLNRIKEFDAQCDVLIVFLHAGTEEVFTVSSYQKDMAKALVDAGADVVVGGHSHTLQPLEFYNGKLIIYSIGNLIFWHIDDDIDGLTAVFDLTVNKEGYVSLKLHPLFIKNYKVYYLTDGEGSFSDRYAQIIKLMNDLCEPNGIGVDEEGNVFIATAGQSGADAPDSEE